MTLIKRHIPLFLILLATLVIYSLSLKNGFVNLDDPLLVTQNPHVQQTSFANIGYVFTHLDPELYIPLTFLSYQTETWILGNAAWHYHLLNVLLHLGCIVLVYTLILRLTKKKVIAVIVTALFALHPINAETVLWVSSRKDLLCTFFTLASLLSFLEFRDSGGKEWYVSALVLAICAFLSKVTAITIPLLLILIDWYEGKRMTRDSVAKLLPFFLLSLIFGIVAVLGKTHITAMESMSMLFLMAARSTAFYLQMVFIPAGQSVLHTLHGFHPTAFLLSFILIIVISAVTFRYKKQMPELLFGWLFFFIALAPTFPHYSHGNEYLVIGSERYLYLPCIGIFLMVAAMWMFVMDKVRPSESVKRFVIGGSICVLFVLSYLTVLRTFVFEDSVVFNADILQKEPQDARTVYNFGLALEADARPFDAEIAYKNALLIRPDFADAAVNLGILSIKEGRIEDGLAMLTKATMMQPAYFKPFFNLGVAQQNAGNFDAAIHAYQQTLELFPDYPEALKNLATVYGKKKMYREAIATYEKLAAIDPVFAEQYQKVRGRMP